jgi:hypothetical protein
MTAILVSGLATFTVEGLTSPRMMGGSRGIIRADTAPDRCPLGPRPPRATMQPGRAAFVAAEAGPADVTLCLRSTE